MGNIKVPLCSVEYGEIIWFLFCVEFYIVLKGFIVRKILRYRVKKILIHSAVEYTLLSLIQFYRLDTTHIY